MSDSGAATGGGLLAGHVVLVTGATGPRVASGICAAVHAAGARLVVNGLTEGEVERTVSQYPGSVGVVGDVARAADVDRMVDTVVERCGALTGLVNNAGIGLRRPFFEATEDEFDRVVDVDFRGVWLTSRAFARLAIDRRQSGSIVNISSVHARSTIGRYSIYAGAKAGVEGLTRGFAADLGPYDIRCNAVAPGYVPPPSGAGTDVPQGEPTSWADSHTRNEQFLQRLVDPVDCGWAAAFLLSDLSRSITGQVVPVDAGLTARLYNRPVSEATDAIRDGA